MKKQGQILKHIETKGKEKRRNKTTTKQEEGWCGGQPPLFTPPLSDLTFCEEKDLDLREGRR
jgi:hypothetical protein